MPALPAATLQKIPFDSKELRKHEGAYRKALGELDSKDLQKIGFVKKSVIPTLGIDAIRVILTTGYCKAAAKLEKKRLFTTVSYPTQPEYATSPKLAKGVNRYMKEKGLPQVNSALELFDWADECFCPSIHELEPIEKENVTFCGSLKKASISAACQIT